MAWILVVLGVLVTAGGLWLLARSPAASAVEMEANQSRAKAVGETPWDVLMAPVESEAVSRKRAAGPFRMGLLLGLGVGVVIAGAMLAVAGNGTPSKDDLVRIAQQKYHLTVVDPAVAQTAPASSGSAASPASQSASGTASTGASATSTAAGAATGAASGGSVQVTVAAGDAWGDVAQKLKDAGVISDMHAFLNRLTDLKADTLLQQGTFTLTTNMTNDSVIQKLTGQGS